MAVNQTLAVELVSQDAARNQSQVRILWQSVQNNGSYNLYERTAYYYVSVNGGVQTRYAVQYTLPRNTAAVIADTVLTVPHDSLGAAAVTVRTWMDTRISAGVVELEKTISLPAIPRASEVTLGADMVVLTGEDTAVEARIQPAGADYHHTLTLQLAGYENTQTLEAGVLDAQIPVPMALAAYMEGRTTAQARVILRTFSGENRIGQQEKLLTVSLGAGIAPYAIPTIEGFAAERCDETGAPAEDGPCVQVRAGIAWSGLGGWNQLSATVSYRDPSGGIWQEAGQFDPGAVNIYPLPDDGEYEIRLLAEDRITQVYALQILDTGEVLMEYHAREKRLEFKPHVTVPSLGLCDQYDEEKASLALNSAGEAMLDMGPMLQKVFSNGVWVGNAAPLNRTGAFSARAGDSGFFIDTAAGKVYVVSGENMQNVYTGESIARFG